MSNETTGLSEQLKKNSAEVKATEPDDGMDLVTEVVQAMCEQEEATKSERRLESERRRASGRRVVCAALLIGDHLVCGPRHFDQVMSAQLRRIKQQDDTYKRSDAIQGFIDQRGVFMTREEAWVVAEAAGQILYRCGGDGRRLFSENLY